MKIIHKKEFAKAVFDKHVEAFMVYVTFLSTMAIHLVIKAQITLLVDKKMQILAKYSNFSNVFLKKKTLILLKATKSNQYTIKFQKN